MQCLKVIKDNIRFSSLKVVLFNPLNNFSAARVYNYFIKKKTKIFFPFFLAF